MPGMTCMVTEVPSWAVTEPAWVCPRVIAAPTQSRGWQDRQPGQLLPRTIRLSRLKQKCDLGAVFPQKGESATRGLKCTFHCICTWNLDSRRTGVRLASRLVGGGSAASAPSLCAQMQACRTPGQWGPHKGSSLCLSLAGCQ